MKEKLESLGWKMYYDCQTCGGRKQYFNHTSKPGYDIRVNAKTGTFRIYFKNQLSGGPFWAYQLEKQLKAHGIG